MRGAFSDDKPAVRDVYGHRARIGLIYMASSTVMEAEFAAMCPEGVSFHTSRIHLPEASVAGLSAMMADDAVERCTRQLAEAPLHVIVFGGTSATFVNGIGWDIAVCQRMHAVSGGIPATTTSTASLEALRSFGAKRISLVTPYIDEVTERGRRFFSDNGFTVVNSAGMGIRADHAIGAVTTQAVYDFTRRHASRDIDAVFISCTNLRTIGAIAALEANLGVPVVSAVQASFWSALRRAGVADKVAGYGSLLAQ